MEDKDVERKILNDCGLEPGVSDETLSVIDELETTNLPYIHPIINLMVGLRKLRITKGNIRQIENINNLKNLEVLDLRANQIRFLSGLENLKNLKHLILDNNPINSIKKEDIVHLTNLRRLSLIGSEIWDLRGTSCSLSNFVNLKHLSLKVHTETKKSKTHKRSFRSGSQSFSQPSLLNVVGDLRGSSFSSFSPNENRGPFHFFTSSTSSFTSSSPVSSSSLSSFFLSFIPRMPPGDQTTQRNLIEPTSAETTNSDIGTSSSATPPNSTSQNFVQNSAHNGHTKTFDSNEIELKFEEGELHQKEDDDTRSLDGFSDTEDESDDDVFEDETEGTDSYRQADAPSPVCAQPKYREFFITQLPGLLELDGIYISADERTEAQQTCRSFFEDYRRGELGSQPIPRSLSMRQLGSFLSSPISSRSSMSFSGVRRSDSAGKNAFFKKCLSKSKHFSKMNSSPRMKLLCPFLASPRQFEYHPKNPGWLLIGTTQGQLLVVNHHTNNIIAQYTTEHRSAVLGLCWLHNDPLKFIAGSDDGQIRLFDVARMQDGRNPIIYNFKEFEHLTSVHINCEDDYFLSSGYSHNVGLYDLKTGQLIETIPELHKEHINVLKWAHHSPTLFATSSFDKTIKLWDMRNKCRKPVFEKKSENGNVMVCFSPDDRFLLASAVDNEVTQYRTDGQLDAQFKIKKKNSDHNYTRSYYMNGQDYIISGSCEESVVRIYCAKTFRFCREVNFSHLHPMNNLYCQSLRGDPFNDFHFSVIVSYNPPSRPSNLVSVNLLMEEENSSSGA